MIKFNARIHCDVPGCTKIVGVTLKLTHDRDGWRPEAVPKGWTTDHDHAPIRYITSCKFFCPDHPIAWCIRGRECPRCKVMVRDVPIPDPPEVEAVAPSLWDRL